MLGFVTEKMTLTFQVPASTGATVTLSMWYSKYFTASQAWLNTFGDHVASTTANNRHWPSMRNTARLLVSISSLLCNEPRAQKCWGITDQVHSPTRGSYAKIPHHDRDDDDQF